MTRVLVTGAGGAAGVSVVRALMANGVDTVAADPDPLAAGRHLADRDVALPHASAPEFAEAVVAAAARTAVDAVVCTVAEEMVPLASVTWALREAGVSLWLSPAEAVQTCIDKQRFADAARAAGLPIPMTSFGSADGVPGPWVVKPRFGRGSRDVHLVDEVDDLASAVRSTPEPIVQTRCAGREFTADALVGHDGSVAGFVARWRLETKAGISTRGETFSDPLVAGLVHATVDAIGLQAACNIQGFVDHATGSIELVEVNPRFSGGLPLAQAAGADLVGEMLRGTLGLPIRPERLVARDGVVMTRYFDEVFFDTAALVERA
jgi:carbamoyl-phosphate synthase large subunit